VCQLTFPENTILSPPPRKVVNKREKKNVRSALKESSMDRIPSMWERIDSQFFDSQPSQTKTSFQKRKGAHIGNSSCSQASTLTIHLDPNLP